MRKNKIFISKILSPFQRVLWMFIHSVLLSITAGIQKYTLNHLHLFVISSQAFAKNTAVSRFNENILAKKCFSGNSWQARNFCERILSWLSPSGKVQTLTHRGRPSQVEASFKVTAAWSWWWVCGRAWCQHKMPAPWLRSVETVETRVDEAWHLCVFSRSQLPRESIPLDCRQHYK